MVCMSRRKCFLATAICLSAGLILVGSGSPPLPDSVLPCAPCHHDGVDDQIAEWLASPYSEARGGRGCVDCHGLRCSGNPGGRTHRPDVEPRRAPGPSDAVRLSVTAVCAQREVNAQVAISNVGAGHRFPSGSSGRTLILEVREGDRGSKVVEAPLPPFATRLGRHRFALPVGRPVRVEARLMLLPIRGSPRVVAQASADCAEPPGVPGS